MAQSHIRALEEVAAAMENGLAAYENDQDTQSERDFVFLDPTFPISIRSMQAKYPQFHFTRLAYHEEDRYETYYGLMESSGSGLQEMISRAVIVSRSDFVHSVLNPFQKEVYYSGEFTIFTIPVEESKRLANSYHSLFLRT